MKKKIVSLILAVLMFAQITVYSAENSLSYTKQTTAYTVSNEKYYLATLEKNYNGVQAGSQFYVDSSGKVVTDKLLLEKLNVIKLYDNANFAHIELYRDNITYIYNREIVKNYVECSRQWINNGQAANFLGSACIKSLKIMFDTANSDYEEVLDGVLDFSIDTFNSISSAHLALVSSGVIKAAGYANQFNHFASELSKYPVQMYDYEQLESFLLNYSSAWASYTTVQALLDATIKDILSNDTGYLAGFNVTFKNITAGVIDVAFSSLNDMFLYLDDDTFLDFDDTIAAIYELGQVNLHKNSSAFYENERGNTTNIIFYTYHNVSDEEINIHEKLSQKTVQTSNYSTGTYTPKYSDGCNIRSTTDSSSSSNIVGGIVYGTSFVVTKVDGVWGYTTYNNISGWVCLDYANKASSSNINNTTTNISTFNSKLEAFKIKYPNNSTYVDNPSLTGGYQCFGFANELALTMFGSYPTNSMSATNVNIGWTRTYGGNAVDNLCIGDIVRYHMHSIFITNIIGDTIYFCEALGDAGNRVRYEQTISRSTLKSYVSSTLWHDNASTAGWVAHYNNGLPSPPEATITYSDIIGGVYQINSGNNYLTAPVDTSTSDNGGDIFISSNNGQATQLFEISKYGNAYIITSKSSTYGKVVNIYKDGTAANGDNVTLYSKTGDSTQLWRFEEKNGSYIIRSYNNPNLALTINGNDINVSTCTYSTNQLWNLSIPDDGRNWSDWSEWSATKVDSSNSRNVQTKTVYRYYHYILMYSNGNCGAYPVTSETFNYYLTNHPVTQKDFHNDIYSDTALTKVSTLTYDKVYDCYENIHCSDDYSYSTNANYVYYLGTETWYRYRDLQYTITFDANGGTGNPASQTKVHDTVLVLNSTVPTRPGYIFKGWSTSSNGDVIYAPGANYTANTDVTLFAVWESVPNIEANTTQATYTTDELVIFTWNEIPGAAYYGLTIRNEETDVAFYDNKVYDTAFVAGKMQAGRYRYTIAAFEENGRIIGNWSSLKYFSVKEKEVDPNALTYTVSSVTGTAGGTVTVDIIMSNNPGVAGITLSVEYDRTIMSCTGYTFKILEGTTNLDENLNNNPIGFSWARTTNYTQNGILVSLTFKINENAPAGEYDLILTSEFGTSNQDKESVTQNLISGKIRIVDSIAGDANGDGLVNSKDAVLLAQHLANWDVEIDLNAADCNGDGAVNSKDAVLLAQYLAGWDVTLG